jgi:hypothetical protein
MVFSPFSIRQIGGNALDWFYQGPTNSGFMVVDSYPLVVTASSDVSLASAAITSARFPWILPAAKLKRDEAVAQLVDGGYFDNSGIETARDLILCLHNALCDEHLPADEPQGNFAIYLISIKGTSDAPVTSTDTMSEVIVPIILLLSTRNVR